MLVIHPEDRTTAFLSILYDGREVRLADQRTDNSQLKHLLNHTSRSERIMLLGHGSDCGLFSRENDRGGQFDRLIIQHSHAYYLRRHSGNIIGIWCHADLFARKEGLHGLYSGMIISEEPEAQEYGIIATQQIIDEANQKMFGQLRQLLDEGCPLHEIPCRLKAMDEIRSQLTEFNYSSFYYL